MQSGYKVLWSEKSVKDLNNIIDYLIEKWPEMEVKRFVSKLDKRLDLISMYPKLFPKSIKKRNIRKSVLTKHITIYYLFDNKYIEVLTVLLQRKMDKRS
jgi:plasmid stabilization system protein ParE